MRIGAVMPRYSREALVIPYQQADKKKKRMSSGPAGSGNDIPFVAHNFLEAVEHAIVVVRAGAFAGLQLHPCLDNVQRVHDQDLEKERV